MKSSQVVFVYKSPDIRDGLPYRDERLHIYRVDPEMLFNELCLNQVCCPCEEDKKDEEITHKHVIGSLCSKVFKTKFIIYLERMSKAPSVGYTRLYVSIRGYMHLHEATRLLEQW